VARGDHRRGRLAAVAAWLVLPLAVLAATGWLYLIRDNGTLGFGPRVDGALPLQQLAGNDAQRLSLVVLAWLPAGAAAAAALAAGTRLGRFARTAVVTLFTFVVLVVAGAAADDVARNAPPLTSHLLAQRHRDAVWIAAGLAALGAVMVGRRPRPG
jgi:hypothetical protein